MEERIQKILSSCGCGSRRTMEEYITAGRVTVNGIPATLGMKADLAVDNIQLDGQTVGYPKERTYLMLNKPRGFVTTLSDEQGRRTVAELVSGCGKRVWPVGRLDLNSEGLLFLTDDGRFTNRLLHPSHEVEKEYLVWVCGDVPAALPALRASITLDGIPLKPAKVHVYSQKDKGAALLTMVIREGKNRQIRRMCQAAGLHVVRLKRVREGPVSLDPSLRPGQWRKLNDEELASLGVKKQKMQE